MVMTFLVITLFIPFCNNILALSPNFAYREIQDDYSLWTDMVTLGPINDGNPMSIRNVLIFSIL
jgi:hypothetical protein